jgi:hypothetical protein
MRVEKIDFIDSEDEGAMEFEDDAVVLSIASPHCRWCQEELWESPNTQHACPSCGATQEAFGYSETDSGRGFEFYMNPDSSIFLEFIKSDGKTSRVTLSPELLQAMGVVTTFVRPPKGCK